jgi:membrane-associated protein
VYFGNFPWVKKHFELVILAVVAISVLPIVIEVLKNKNQQDSH